MMYFVGLVVLPYITFVFLAEGLNPFSKPSGSTTVRSRWRLGRRSATAVMLGMIAYGALANFTPLETLPVLVASAVLTVGLVLHAFMRRHHHDRQH